MPLYLNSPQQSPDWFTGRMGAITASMFSECRNIVGGLSEQQRLYVDLVGSGMTAKQAATEAGYKSAPKSATIEKALKGEKVGDYSQKAKQYAFKLAVERLSGQLLDDPEFDTWQARRGRELEPDARLCYEARKAVLVEEVGLALTDDRKFGTSMDGLVNDDGSVEIKCFLAPSKLMPVLLENDPALTRDQMQGSLWITGRQWCDFVLYCPLLKSVGRELTIIREHRDEDYIHQLEQDLLAFDQLVCSYQDQLREQAA